MKHHINSIVVAAALAAALPSAALADHTCWMPSAVHVNIYSNMLSAAAEATGYRSRAEAAYDKWKQERDVLASKADALSALQAEYQTLVEDYRRAQSTARPSLINEPDNLRNLRDSLVSITERAISLKTKFDGLSGSDGWAAASRRCAQAATDFEDNATAFADKDTEAQRLRLNGIKWECVLNLYRENFMAAKTKFETIGKNLESGMKEVSREEEAAKRADSDIRSRLTQIAALPSQIAESLGVKGVSTAEGLLEVMEDWSAPRVTVRFRSQGMVVTDGERLLKKKITPLARPADPLRPGLVFLYWRKAATREKFPDDKWDKPVEEDIDFDAVWGYEVRVAGLDHVFQIVLENEGTPPSLASVFADPKFLNFRDNPLPAPPPGYRLAGWQDSDKNHVDEATLVIKSLTISPVYEEIVHTITWQDADGTYLDKETFSQSRPPVKRALPQDHDGFHYKYWSLEPDGEEWRKWGQPLDRDIVLFAVREADHVVRFCTEDRHEISQAGVKHGDRIARSKMPQSEQIPVLHGKVFVAWQDDAGADFDFAERAVDADTTLFARYRPESPAETIERQVGPVRDRFPLPLLVGADVALAVLLVVLLAAGPKAPRAPKPKAPAVVEAEPAAGEGAQPPPEADSASANA